MKKKQPTIITARPTYAHPERGLALEAGILSALAVAGEAVSGYRVAQHVQHHLRWATSGEIYEKLDRMIEAGRAKAVHVKGRVLPLYALPYPVPHPPNAPHPSPAARRAARDNALDLPA